MNCTPGMMFCTWFFAVQLPVSAMGPWPIPWYPPENAMTVPLPVAVLQSLMAASVASVPEGEQNWTLALSANSGGRIENRFSKNISFVGVMMSNAWRGAPDWMRSTMAWLTSSLLWPSASVPAPLRKSR